MCNTEAWGNDRCDGVLCGNAGECRGDRCDWFQCKTTSPEEALAGGIIAAIVIGVIIFCCCLPFWIFWCCFRAGASSGEKALKESRKAMEAQNAQNAQMQNNM